ncbi:MAG: uracil-DNA glycosylase [Rhodospirillaceae bacterium]|nr:uracil-DNA glycosylase [Rhodospirillaceae bacterium]
MAPLLEPDVNCQSCPRLSGFRAENVGLYPDFFNGPVPPFGSIDARLLVVGLAPGLKGANRTGRPFTGDGAGELLYPTLIKTGLAKGNYIPGPDARIDDGLEMVGARITNAVRCVPPQNKVIAAETSACNGFLGAEIKSMKNLEVIIALGGVAHGAVLNAVGLKKSAYKFTHGAMFELPFGIHDHIMLTDSYHCSRYNTNTGRLTTQMFEDVFVAAVKLIKGKN